MRPFFFLEFAIGRSRFVSVEWVRFAASAAPLFDAEIAIPYRFVQRHAKD
jgi:hypothetical protein